MKINLCKLLIGFFCVNFCTGCSGSNSSPAIEHTIGNKMTMTDTNYAQVNFLETILRIDKSTENSETWNALFLNKEFIDIYEHGLYYMDSAIQFLGNKEFTLTQKKISINSMQGLKIEDYVKFCEACRDLYDKSKISEDILDWAITPNFSNKYLIIRNYTNPSVIELLNSIKNYNNISKEFKDYINEILTGASWETQKEINGEIN